MSAAAPVTTSRPASRASRAWAMLRATGPAGIASAIVIAIASFIAIFGTYTQRLRASVPRPGWKPRRRAQADAGEERQVP
jgi:hypothetical protein